MPKIVVKPNKRGIVIGKTGSGKTEFVKWLLRQVEKSMPIFIVDIKHDWLGENPVWAKGKEKGTVDKPRLVKKYDPRWHVQVIQPDGPADVEPSFANILKRRGRVFVYIDETRGLASATQVPTQMGRIWTQGRALSIPAWVGSQSARGIPLIFKSQADYWVIYDVSRPDLESIEEYIPLSGSQDLSTADSARYMREELGEYRFFYYQPDMDEPALMQPIPFKEKKDATVARRGNGG